MKELFRRHFHFMRSTGARKGFSLTIAVITVLAGLGIFTHSTKSVSQSATLPLTDPVTPDLQEALLMYQRIGGINIPIDSAVLTTMANQIGAGNLTGAAATVMANEPNFYNITVREMFAAMSTRAEVQNAPTSDFVADGIGAVRDNLDGRTLLTGNFIYTANPTLVPNVPDVLITDILQSNLHYAYLDTNNVNLGAVLVNSGSQEVVNSAGTAVAVTDAAGLLTSYAFLGAHAIMGTNRRVVQYAFREFECIDISDFAENGPDNMVGRDVDRFSGGSDVTYQTKCKLCHNRLDSMRPAFARYDFDSSNTEILYSLFNPVKGNATTRIGFDTNGIATKYNINTTVFPAGYDLTNTAWTNTATDATSQQYFGWSGSTQGSSANQFGAMLAASSRFPQCMAQRVFQAVCKRAPLPTETGLIASLGQGFVSAGYNFQSLFAQVAAAPNCIGE